MNFQEKKNNGGGNYQNWKISYVGSTKGTAS
jgi:hypothetical protein